MSETKSHYSGFSLLKSHPVSVIMISDPLSQYLLTNTTKTYTDKHKHIHTYIQTFKARQRLTDRKTDTYMHIHIDRQTHTHYNHTL